MQPKNMQLQLMTVASLLISTLRAFQTAITSQGMRIEVKMLINFSVSSTLKMVLMESLALTVTVSCAHKSSTLMVALFYYWYTTTHTSQKGPCKLFVKDLLTCHCHLEKDHEVHSIFECVGLLNVYSSLHITNGWAKIHLIQCFRKLLLSAEMTC